MRKESFSYGTGETVARQQSSNSSKGRIMVRGHAKADAQERNAKRQAELEKNGTQRGMADKAMVYTCALCKQQCPNVKLFKQHYEAKHATECFPAAAQAELDALEAKKANAAAAAAAPAAAAKPKKKKAAGGGVDDLEALLSAGGASISKKKGGKKG